MLSVLIRAAIVYIVLLIAMRLMGKRQLSELQPFELAITFLIAEVAAAPMSHTSIPIWYGIIPVLTLLILHIFISTLAFKSINFRKILNGKPALVVDNGKIDYQIMKQLNMNTNDLMEGLRNSGYFTPADVAFAVLETNGKLSVLPKPEAAPATAQALKLKQDEASLPYMMISEGKIIENNIKLVGVTRDLVDKELSKNKLKLNQVLLFLLSNGGDVFIQPQKGEPIEYSINLEVQG